MTPSQKFGAMLIAMCGEDEIAEMYMTYVEDSPYLATLYGPEYEWTEEDIERLADCPDLTPADY